MRRILAAFAVALCAACANPVSPPSREIETILNDQAAAWTRGDLNAFCSVYADDATFISPSGITRGRQAVLDRYRRKYVDKAGMGALRLEILEVRASNAREASVVARWTLTWPDKPNASGSTLLVFEKTKDGWRIVQDASM
jgi:uncharacterized protein (TIGR02246 family)